MYKPLTERLPEGTTQNERITHLIDYYRTFLCEGEQPDWTDFDYQVIRTLIEMKLKSQAVEHLS